MSSAIAETEDVKGLPSLPMTGGSAVWMASGVYSVCHVIISTDRGLGIGCPAPKHHGRVPVTRQSREDVTGRRGPYIRHTERRPTRRPRSSQLPPTMATCRPLCSHSEYRRSFFPSSGEPPLPGACRRRTRDPHTSPIHPGRHSVIPPARTSVGPHR